MYFIADFRRFLDFREIFGAFFQFFLDRLDDFRIYQPKARKIRREIRALCIFRLRDFSRANKTARAPSFLLDYV